MISFKSFLANILFPRQLDESLAAHTQHITHLSHVEDLGHEYGHEGGNHAIEALHAAHEHISHGAHNSNLTTKTDGGVSVVVGHHPVTGQHFVAYKSALKDIGTNKEGKLNFSYHDIEKHFADKPWLKEKMKHVFDHAHKILPKHGVYQGDFLFDEHDKKHEGNRTSFTPNTITYSAKKDSAEGEKINKAKLGISFHTAYDSHGGQLHSRPVESDELRSHDDTYNLNTANNTHRAHYSEAAKHEFKQHLAAATSHHHQQNYEAIEPVKEHVSTYINKTVRHGETPSVHGLISHLHEKGQRDAEKVKTEKSKEAKLAAAEQLKHHVASNSSAFDNYFKMHHHLQQAKNVLVKTLDNADHPLEHHIKGEKTSPEGYVFRHHGLPIKLVNRHEFSKKNFETAR